MTTTPLPPSLAAECAEFDRYRLDAYDQLVQDADASTLRAMLGSATDLCATLARSRDERVAQVDSLTVAHRAELTKLRAEIDAAVGQIATVTTERDALAARVREMEARPVLTVERLDDALQPVLFGTAERAKIAAAAMAKLGAVTLPAQDRLATLEAHFRDMLKDADDAEAKETWSYCAELISAEIRAIAKLGAPATTPVATGGPVPAECHECGGNGVILGGSDGQGHQEEWPCRSCASESMTVGRYVQAMMLAVDGARDGIKGDPQPPLAGRLWPMQWNAAARAAIKLGVPSTVCTRADEALAPGAPTGLVLAAVSSDDLCMTFYLAARACPGSEAAEREAGIRAVLDRLKVSIVAPVDPEAVARDFYSRPLLASPKWDEFGESGRKARIAAMRATLTAAGIPVTPEGVQ